MFALLFLSISFIGISWFVGGNKSSTQEVKILVANLDGPEDYKITQSVLSRMREAVENNIQGVKIVPLRRTITEQDGPQIAQEEGRKAGATLVLWGYYNSFYRGQVHVEQINTPRRLHLLKGTFDINPPAARRKGITVEEDLSAELNYLVLLVTGLTRFEVEDYAAAIKCYDQALNQRNTPEQLIDQLDIYLQRGQAWLYLEATEAFGKHRFGDTSAGPNKFYLGGEEFSPNAGALDAAITNFTTVITARPDSVGALYNRALAYTRKGNYEQALGDYESILKYSPDDAQAYSGRGISYNLLQKYDQAIADYNVAERLTQQQDAEVYFNRAISFANKNEFRQALDDFSRALAIKPNDADTIIYRARIYATLGYYPQAVSELDRALKEVSQSAFYYSSRGAAWATIGDMDKALADFSEVISLEPNFATGYHSRGHIFRELGRMDEALADFGKVISLDPKAGYAYNDHGTCWVGKGNDSEAVKDFTESINIDPDEGLPLVNRAFAYRRANQHQLAIQDLTRATELDFDQKAVAYDTLGEIKSDVGDYLGAIDAYASAIQLEPGLIDRWLAKAALWMKVRRYDSAMREYRTAFSLEMALSSGAGLPSRSKIYSTAISNLTEALKYDSGNNDGYVARSFAYLMSSNYDGALQDINVSIKINSSSDEAYRLQGIILTNLKLYDEARNSFDQSLKLNPQSAHSWFYRGLTYFRQEQFAKAVEDYSQAKNLAPDYLAPKIEIGRCYALLHDYKAAIDEFSAIPEMSPDYDQILLLRGRAKVDMGNKQEAVNDLRRAFNLARSDGVRAGAAADLERLGVHVEMESFHN